MQSHLQEILVQLGEVNHAIDDIIGYLNQMEDDLNQFDKIYGDPGHVILHLRKIQVVLVLFRVMCDPDRGSGCFNVRYINARLHVSGRRMMTLTKTVMIISNDDI